MTKNETKIIEVVANDIKWVVKTLGSMEEHFKTLNNNVAKNTLNVAVNSSNIGGNRRMTNRQWWLIGVIVGSVVGLKFTGIV